MEKQTTKKIFAVMILGFFLFSLSLSFVSAQTGFNDLWNLLKDEIVDPYIMPSEEKLIQLNTELDKPTAWTIISLLGFIVFAAIIFELASLLPLSTWTNVLIGVSAIIILGISGAIRTAVGGLMLLIAGAAGIGGMFGMVMVAVIFIILAIAVFTGATWANKWVHKIRFNKELQKKTSKAYKAAADVSALNTQAANVEYK